MSHFTRIRTKMTVKKYLLRALEDVGLRWQEGSVRITDYGRNRTRPGIKVGLEPGHQPMGFVENDGIFELVGSPASIRGVSGYEIVGRLQQRYALHATRDKLEEQGFVLVDEEQADASGELRLVLRRTV